MKNKLKQLTCSALLLAVLAGCSSIPTNIRTPAGAKVSDSSGGHIGNTPTTVQVLCGPSSGIGALMWATIVLIPVERLMSNPETEFDITLEENSLTKAGLNTIEIKEIMNMGNVMHVTFKSGQHPCATAGKLEIDSKTIRAVLIEGESASYTWQDVNGGWTRAQIRRKN